MKVMEEIKQCAAYLKDTGHEVDVDDLNENSEEDTNKEKVHNSDE